MKFLFFTFAAFMCFLSVCFPDQTIAAVKALNSFFRDLGITSFDDFTESGKALFNEVKGKLGQ